jgi:hypothetical protein
MAIAGFALPYYLFRVFPRDQRLRFPTLLSQLLANDISTFFAVDLIITAIVLVVFVYRESLRLQMRNWWLYVVATLVVGPSFAFPLFLFVRSGELETDSA